MKKRTLSLLAAAALTALALTGCANAAAYDGARAVAPQTGESPSAASDAAPTPSPAAPVAAPAGDTTAGVAGSADPDSGYISEEAAKAAALEHAGVAEADLDGIRVRLDYDDGRAVYDVEFLHRSDSGLEEYDYEIDAADGRIVSYDYDAEGLRDGRWTDDDAAASAAGTAVSAEQAKQIALEHAGVAEADVYGLEMELEHDDGRTCYEFSWKVDFTEYDCDIDADTGEVLHFSQERDD